MKIFGEEIPSFGYQRRKCVYSVAVNADRKVAVVYTKNGYYCLPGGGIEFGETHEQCLKREVVEELGREIVIEGYIGRAQRYFINRNNEPLLNDGYFYLKQARKRPLQACGGRRPMVRGRRIAFGQGVAFAISIVRQKIEQMFDKYSFI